MALKRLVLGNLNLNNSDPNSGFVTKETNIWNMAEKDLNLQANMQEAGSKSLFQRFTHRKVTVKGFVRDADSDAFEQRLNDIKAYGLSNSIDLSVGYWGGNLTYKAILRDFKPDRKHLPNFSNYKLIIICESPFGVGTAAGDADTGDFITDAHIQLDTDAVIRSFYTHREGQPRPTYYIRPLIAFNLKDRQPLDGTPLITHVVIGNNVNGRKLTILVSLALSLAPGVNHIGGADVAVNANQSFIIDCKNLLTLRGDPDSNLLALPEFDARGVIPRWNPAQDTAQLTLTLLPAGARANIYTKVIFKKEFV